MSDDSTTCSSEEASSPNLLHHRYHEPPEFQYDSLPTDLKNPFLSTSEPTKEIFISSQSSQISTLNALDYLDSQLPPVLNYNSLQKEIFQLDSNKQSTTSSHELPITSSISKSSNSNSIVPISIVATSTTNNSNNNNSGPTTQEKVPLKPNLETVLQILKKLPWSNLNCTSIFNNLSSAEIKCLLKYKQCPNISSITRKAELCDILLILFNSNRFHEADQFRNKFITNNTTPLSSAIWKIIFKNIKNNKIKNVSYFISS